MEQNLCGALKLARALTHLAGNLVKTLTAGQQDQES